MFGIPIGFLIRLGIALALAAAALYAWHLFTGHYIAIGEARVQLAWDTDKAMRAKALAQAEAEGEAIRARAEAQAKEHDNERQARIAASKARLHKIPPAVGADHFPGVAVGVLNDAVRDSAAPTGAAAKPDRPAAESPEPDSTVAEVTGWGITCVAFYDACRTRVDELIDFYRSVRAAQPGASK